MDVYYDDGCSFCRRAMRVAQRLDFFRRLRFFPLSDQFGKEGPLQHLSKEELLYDLHGIDKKGSVIRGLAVYQAGLRAMIWLAPLGWLLAVPGISHLGAAVYRRIADSRYGASCSIAPDPLQKDS